MQQDLNHYWSHYYDQGKDFRLIDSHTIDTFLGFSDADAPKTALDIGCGTGQMTRELWHRGYHVTGIDVSESAITIARRLTTAPHTSLCYLQANIEQYNEVDLPFQPFGLITCKFVYAFLLDKHAFLHNIAHLLADKGIFVVITPLLEHTPPEKRGIATHPTDIALLREYFTQITWYEDQALGYFVGKQKKSPTE